MASWLPGFILDFMLTLPYRLENLRLSLQEARQIELRDEPEIQSALQTTPVVQQKKTEEAQDEVGEVSDEPASTRTTSEVDSGSVHSQDTQEDASRTSSIADSWVMHDGNDPVSPPNEAT